MATSALTLRMPSEDGQKAAFEGLGRDDFIRLMSTINVRKFTALRSFTKAQSDDLPLFSRDEPTRFQYSCRNRDFGCDYSAFNQESLPPHELMCSLTSEAAVGTYEAAHPFTCSNCPKRFDINKKLLAHKKKCTWVPVRCPAEDCTSTEESSRPSMP